jgi:hypothetical protein
MATRQSRDSSTEPFQQAIFPDSLDHIPAASRLEAAGRTEEWADRHLINPDQAEQGDRPDPFDPSTDLPDHGDAFATASPNRFAADLARIGKAALAC